MELAKNGLVFSEHQNWKNKKKILSKTFNYEFIISKLPEMAKIADKTFEEFEQEYWRQHP
jgi:cytochrome P450